MRGFRVELDEVEAALTEDLAVAEAAVYLLRNEDGEAYIEASVLLTEKGGIDAPTLLKNVGQRLPHYSVPTVLHIRESFPRTGSGKIDRRALQTLAKQENHSTIGFHG